jgi:flavin reductase (DIM6/NTAB) family NADH-FMN oxidoreductase RutF/nitroreductase
MKHEKIMPIDVGMFRTVMRHVASSVAVITTSHEGHLHGMTATAISSVSAAPPRILIVINRSTRSHSLISGSRNFVVNILADHQRNLGERFSGKSNDRFDDVSHHLGWRGTPILDGAAAHLECELVSETEAETHTIFIGEVVGGGVSGASPLLYHDGAYKGLTPRVSSYEISSLFLERWSPRAFSDAPITDDELMPMFEAARWSPSSRNAQPWRFVYAHRNGLAWDSFLDCLHDENKSWAFRAAALIAFVSKETIERHGQTVVSPTHVFDTGAAWMSFAQQASLMGWHTHCIGGFDKDRLRDTLNVPADHRINAIAAIGKIGDPAILAPELRNREIPSGRDPLEQMVFEGSMSR